MSNLLIADKPIQVLPKLAKAIGLNEAIVLQQLHYWLANPKNKGHQHNGHKWVYNTYEQWQEDNFPFWSTKTIQRTFSKLEELGLVVAERLDKQNYNHTKYYRIDYDKLELIDKGETDCPDDEDKLSRSGGTNRDVLNRNTETTTEITTNTSSASPSRVDKIRKSIQEANNNLGSQEYVEGLRERFPGIALGVALKPDVDGALNNVEEYPPDTQDIVKAFCKNWKILPPPKGTSAFGKWIKDAREVKKQLQNIKLPPEPVFAEAHYIWKTPPEFSKVPREFYEGNFRVSDIGSVSKLVWEACSGIADGKPRRKYKKYTRPDGSTYEVET